MACLKRTGCSKGMDQSNECGQCSVRTHPPTALEAYGTDGRFSCTSVGRVITIWCRYECAAYGVLRMVTFMNPPASSRRACERQPAEVGSRQRDQRRREGLLGRGC
eukprot:284975-Prorocentrum_minimum.AAC.1